MKLRALSKLPKFFMSPYDAALLSREKGVPSDAFLNLSNTTGDFIVIHRNKKVFSLARSLLENVWSDSLHFYMSLRGASKGMERCKPGFLLVEYSNKKEYFMEWIDQVHRKYRDCPIVVVVDGSVPVPLTEFVNRGATRCLLERDIPHRLRSSISEIIEGGIPISSFVTRSLVRDLQGDGVGVLARDAGLTDRELDCLNLLTKGLLYKEIASELGLGHETVRTYLRRGYQKLGVRTRSEAIIRILSCSRCSGIGSSNHPGRPTAEI